jgi:hypothetical protein
MKTSGGEPSTRLAAWKGAADTELVGTPTRPEKSCWGETGESGFRQSNTQPSSRLLSDPRVWLRLLCRIRREIYKIIAFCMPGKGLILMLVHIMLYRHIILYNL